MTEWEDEQLQQTIQSALPIFGIGILILLLTFAFCICLCCLRKQRVIERGYRQTRFRAIRDGSEPCSCPICLEEFSAGEKIAVVSNCRHLFHKPCLRKWLLQNNSCPLCKAVVRNVVSETSPLLPDRSPRASIAPSSSSSNV